MMLEMPLSLGARRGLCFGGGLAIGRRHSAALSMAISAARATSINSVV
jgi:hypothetical protein